MPKPNREGSSPQAPLKSPSELSARLDLAAPQRLLLVDAPAALESLIANERGAERLPETIGAEAIRAVKGEFDAALVWREDRSGSHALLDRVVARLAPQATLWVVTAMRKVSGPRTPAARRLELPDLVAAFSKAGLRNDREARITAWHVGYRFVRR
jgi:hypothetical protein